MAKKKSHGGKREGAGRKPGKADSVTVSASIPKRLAVKLDRVAKAKDLTRSGAILEAIREFIS